MRDAKEKRDLELSPFGTLGLAQQERDRSERKDRDTRQMTLMALLSSERLREKLRETNEAFDKTRDKGRELLEAIADLRAQLRRERDYLLDHAARHPETGKAIFRYADGSVKDEDGHEVPAAEVKDASMEGTTSGEVWEAHKAREFEADHLETRVKNGMNRLDTAQGTMESGIRKDPDQAEERMDEAKKTQEAVGGDFDDIGGRVKELSAEALKGPVAPARPDASIVGQGPIERLRL